MLEFHDPIPEIAQRKCTGLIAQEYWYQGEQITAANVMFLQLVRRIATAGSVLQNSRLPFVTPRVRTYGAAGNPRSLLRDQLADASRVGVHVQPQHQLHP